MASQYGATTGPPTSFGSNCQLHPIVPWAPISFSSSVLFDTTILFLTLAKVRSNLSNSDVGQVIFRDTLMYFVITAVTNVVVLSIQALGGTHAMIKPAAVPFSTVMTVTMGSRVYLNLKIFERRRQMGQADADRSMEPLSMPRPGKSQCGENGESKQTISATNHQSYTFRSGADHAAVEEARPCLLIQRIA